MPPNSLLTVGQTVDEAAFLFYSLDQACHSQLLADAASANGLPKNIIPGNIAQFTADAVQSPVRWKAGRGNKIILTYLVILSRITSTSSSSQSLILLWGKAMAEFCSRGRCLSVAYLDLHGQGGGRHEAVDWNLASYCSNFSLHQFRSSM